MCNTSNINTFGVQPWDFWTYIAKFGNLSKTRVQHFCVLLSVFGHSLVIAFQCRYIKQYYVCIRLHSLQMLLKRKLCQKFCCIFYSADAITSEVIEIIKIDFTNQAPKIKISKLSNLNTFGPQLRDY